MKKLILVAGILVATAALPVLAGTPCDDVKAQIAKTLDGKGVKNYALDVIAAADVKDQKIVGSCEGGSKKIAYSRGAAKAAAPAEAKIAEPASAPVMKGPAMKPTAKQ